MFQLDWLLNLVVGLSCYIKNITNKESPEWLKNKLISGEEDVKFLGEENEWLVIYCKKKLTEKHFDFFIFGHRHLPLEIELTNNSKYINTSIQN